MYPQDIHDITLERYIVQAKLAILGGAAISALLPLLLTGHESVVVVVYLTIVQICILGSQLLAEAPPTPAYRPNPTA